MPAVEPEIVPPGAVSGELGAAAAGVVSGDEQPPRTPDVAEELAIATGAGFADRLQAGLDRLEREKTEEFDVPGWRGDMKIRVKKLSESERKLANSTAATIALATVAVLLRETDDGPLEEVPGGWNGVAAIMGKPGMSQSKIVRTVLDNGVRVDVFHSQLVAWMAGVQSDLEGELGE